MSQPSDPGGINLDKGPEPSDGGGGINLGKSSDPGVSDGPIMADAAVQTAPGATETPPTPETPTRPEPKKQSASAYDAMLVLAFFFLAGACMLLYLELENYRPSYPWWETSDGKPATTTAP